MKTAGAAIRVSGRVQGVGFRYWAMQRARLLGLTGLVRNEADGSVFTVAEGDHSAIESYIDQLERGPASSAVAEVSVSWREFTGKYPDFRITF
jgi:acylphosphatase